MTSRWPRPPGKRRTREHIIADLSAHHVEDPILRCGFTAERFVHDYGVDLFLFIYTSDGEQENGVVFLQLKATDHLKRSHNGGSVVYRVERRDVLKWLGETYPVFLIVYDAKKDVAYWLYVQAYFKGAEKPPGTGQTVTVRLPVTNVVNEEAIRRFAAGLAAVRPQVKGVSHND